MSEELILWNGYANAHALEILDNTREVGIKMSDLTMVKVPSGGGAAFEVPGIDGTETKKDIEGVIVRLANTRSYWKNKFEDAGGDSPPDCKSDDGRTGFGAPGGKCETCPLAAWGSAPNNGQACKHIQLMFLLPPGDVFPTILKVPPTSIAVVRKYMFGLLNKGMPAHSVMTKVSLSHAKSGGGIKYSTLSLSLAKRLDGVMLAEMKAYKEKFDCVNMGGEHVNKAS